MKKTKPPIDAEIVFGSAEPRVSVAISRDVKAGRLKRVAPKLYTSNLKDPPESIVQRNLYVILGHYFPGAVVSHRSALEGGLARDNTLFLTYKYTKKVALPGVTVRLLKGKGAVEGDMPFMGRLFMASRARALLENLAPARARNGVAKGWSRREIEYHLDEIARVHGEVELNRLRDQARKLARTLKLSAEFKALDATIGAILGTREEKRLTSTRARAQARGTPYGHLQARDKLEKSERLCRQLMEHAADGIFITDASGNLLDVNRRGCEMIGYTREELLRFNARNLFPPEELVARPMRFSEVLAGQAVVIERPLLRKDGTTLPVEVNVKLIEDRLQAIIRDISERKRAEDLTARLGRMVDSTFCEIYVFDQETLRLIQANQGALSSLGYSPKELVSLTFLDLQPEITPENFVDLVKPLLDGRQNQVIYETFQRRKDGSPYPVEVRLQLMRNATLPVYIAVALDISARREAGLQMRKLSGALEQTADLVLITDASGVIEYVNPAFEKVTGYSLDEVRGRTPQLLKSGRHDKEFYARLWSSLRNGEVFYDVFINRRKDGSLYYEEETITPLKDEYGHTTHFISTGKNISEYQHMQERLLYLTQHDILTQLPNRALFMDKLGRAVSRTRLSRRLLSVLSLDVDGLGVINDTLGHEVGDRVLQLLAERLSKCMRNQDTLARLGGDEFGIILEDITTINELSLMIRKIRMALSLRYQIDDHEIPITVSTGISLYPEDGEDAPTLVRNAATALSQAREQGRNNFWFHQADLNAKMAERLDFEADLRRALERKEFLLHYQPQIDLRTERICGVEALLRWQHPQRGLLMPHDFLPLLEETGLIVPLGAWLLRTACEQNSAWQATGLPAVPVAVNISYQQLGEPDYIDLIALILDETGLAPRFLQLEISDRILSREARATQEALGKLNSMGIGLIADDFIVGDSSLKYLKRLPVNGLKIDASLLLCEPDDAEEAVMTNAIVSIAHKQQLRVMAEGVETEQQLRFLQAAGCDVVQGRVFGQPIPAIEVTRLLQSGKLVKS